MVRTYTLSSGDEVLPYVAPAPTDKTPHNFYLMLYEQINTTVNVTALNMTKYAGNCSAELENRCLFEVKQFAADNNAALQGVTWFQSLNDPYTNYRKIQLGESEATYCVGVTGYSDPCLTDGATVLTGSMVLSLVLVFIVGVFV
ncbi:uncharacterized protein LOC135496576 [Lineus longissimus]|uniref:uncharacterized protein LOC135496576 n=1 Tax=Lineus longissimus TaxID=88925 RepID=UPI00315CB699